ncbi:Archaeal primase DnaG/twinkle, TOPRIM domain [uncultured Caudovirales phage]|uniref:DNA helicase/primase n=1 Tax=uncultured Caudovirales phage TaxID=2100421 RepID=A0A6J5MUH7_9CAUD|nr:Archaeal primase DnaG/twinkle, TOPRIM domain [uncultured Caudovirales phage]
MDKTTSQFIKHIPCLKCGSSDGNSIYTDNHQYCHVCQNYIDGDGTESVTPKQTNPMRSFTNYDNSISHSIVDRGLTQATCVAYGVHNDDKNHYYPYFDLDGVLSGIKIRGIADKSFSVQGDWKSTTLFGQSKFAKGGRNVTIHEGELDALAGFQMAGSKYPHVSVKNGASAALKDCKQAYEWLDSFESIIISFDGDEVGQKAANDVAELFGSKCKIVKHITGFKDACDYLKAGKQGDYVSLWWNAEQWTPDGIIAGSTLWEEVNKPVEKSLALYPWEGVNELTYGIRPAELITVTAGSGLGKSQFLREIIWHLLKTTDGNIGCMFMEESVVKTAKSIMSLYANKPLHLPDTIISTEELQNAFDNTLGTDRLFFWDNFGSTDIDNVINRIRYFAKAADCKYVFLDHISMVISAQSNNDERKAIDELMTKLRMLVQETNICLVAVSHLKRPESKGHEEGAATSLSQLRGSGSIAQLSDIVIGLVRNAQADDPIERNTTKVSILKNRFAGLTSPHCASLLYNRETGRMLEIKDQL